jgi:hypothetical protein
MIASLCEINWLDNRDGLQHLLSTRALAEAPAQAANPYVGISSVEGQSIADAFQTGVCQISKKAQGIIRKSPLSH